MNSYLVTLTRNTTRGYFKICSDHKFEEVQMQPSRGENILDLGLTNRSNLINAVTLLPAIGNADHHTICTYSEIKPKYNRQKRRTIYLFHKANWEEIKISLKR